MEDRLYKFARLVEAQTFTKAAARMHISQPALTTAIKKLERELHAELLVRSSHTFALTAAGQIAYEAAKELGKQTHNLRLRLQEAANEKTALNLGMIDSIADLLFVHGNHLHELEEGARLSLTVNNSAQLIKQVSQDELDIALIAQPAHLPQTLRADLVAEEPLVLVTSSTNHESVLRDLGQSRITHFLGYNQNSQTYQLIERYFQKHDIQVQPSFYSTSPEIMRQLVRAGRGTAVLPYLLVKKDLAERRLVNVTPRDGAGISRRIMSVRRNGRAVPTAAEQLLARARSRLQALNTESRPAPTHV